MSVPLIITAAHVYMCIYMHIQHNESTWHCLGIIYASKTEHLRLGNLCRSSSFEETNSPSPCNHWLPISLHLWLELRRIFSIHWSHYVGSVQAAILLRSHEIILLVIVRTHYLALTKHLPTLLQHFMTSWCRDCVADAWDEVRYLMSTCSLHDEQLWISVIDSMCYKKELLDEGECISGFKNNCLECS